jgi:hypothetical protein
MKDKDIQEIIFSQETKPKHGLKCHKHKTGFSETLLWFIPVNLAKCKDSTMKYAMPA